MKLRSLRLHGFKSFADRTTLEFRDGVTAIVGSNGCGKSNVADSIRWVLGEQRASAVRGAKMEEVIFQGTTRRRPLNFAEVSLVFSNEDGRVALPQAEIEVTRKVFREGGSEYALNRNACRLRDIHDLLRDTGLGANAYSVIEAGMIDAILSERAEERRALFEEAAGIGKYKDRRRAAQRRLEQAQTDLERLGDLLGEVESKVRSLARQRRKAQRHAELQARRLDLEVGLAAREVEELTTALAEAAKRRAALAAEEEGARAGRSAAELVLEERRVEAAELSRTRAAAAARQDDVRRRLDAREREVLLADERRSHAEMRIAQLVRERAELLARAAALAAEAARLEEERLRGAEALASVRAMLELRAEENQVIRATLGAHRAESERAAARSRDLARDIAAAEGERGALERRLREGEERAGRLLPRAEQMEAELSRAGAQTELWAGRAEELRLRVGSAAEAAEAAREEIRVLRGRETAARDALRAAEDRLSRLAAQVAAREALERSYEGFSPAVAAVMAMRERFPGVLAPLADFVRPEEGAPSGGVEIYLGALLQALVVEDIAAARALRRWFREEWTGGGSLLLLPLDAPGVSATPLAGARVGVRGVGPGAAWVEALLADLLVVDAEDALSGYAPGARVDALGDVVDARGVVRLGQPVAGEGILARREALAHLRAERNGAEWARDGALGEREALLEGLGLAEERAREAEEVRRLTEGELRRLDAEAAAHEGRRARLLRERDEVVHAIGGAREQAEEAAARLRALDVALEELRHAAAAAGSEVARAATGLAELEARWEGARDEEAELRVTVARGEAELREVERRLGAAAQGVDAARMRERTVEAEAVEIRASLEGLSGVRERAGAEVEELFVERDRAAVELQGVDARLAQIEEELRGVEERARLHRRREAESAEERHRLELESTEWSGRVSRARDRLEAEWGRPWETLVSAARPVEEGDPAAWREEVREIARQVEALGPINMLAVQEHEEEERRLNFLMEQRDDLVKARDDLASAIRQINRTAREVFLDTFTRVRENFHRTFHSLFLGGECDVWLADPDDPLESPIEIHASPRGKRTQRIHLLSGGERTLTALSLLFAIYLVKPSPFCLFDEVDAPLDESNVGRFIQLLQDFKAETQFVVITHNPRTMEAADWIYGVTMEEPGVSSLVGVELEGAWEYTGEERVA
jgi:chromosome segregation protein